MGKELNHPTVKRGTLWLRTQLITVIAVILVLTFAAFVNPSPQLTVFTLIAWVASVVFVLLIFKQIKDLRKEYRYEDDV